ncbi:MAG: iron-sulfur cluster assembly scaffold protein [Candidatus Thorarchaeota archaeon]|nr:iron-sulfur cluster assembly scaffold protein [Candidatus Thorarchaeota archaeon]
MKSTQYSDKVMEHFQNPRNVGTLEGENVAVGRVGNPTCGDLMEMFVRIEDDRIENIKFRTFGCGSAIATSSMITEMVKGKTIEEAKRITRQDVADELDGLPAIKMHCSNLASRALHEAIREYEKGEGEEVESTTQIPCQKVPIEGLEEFIGKGLYREVENLEELKDKRILIVHRDDSSIEMAIKLTGYSDRVVLMTCADTFQTTEDLEKALEESSVKLLRESQLLGVTGEFEVEKAKIRDLDDDDEYELFTDAVVIGK